MTWSSQSSTALTPGRRRSTRCRSGRRRGPGSDVSVVGGVGLQPADQVVEDGMARMARLLDQGRRQVAISRRAKSSSPVSGTPRKSSPAALPVGGVDGDQGVGEADSGRTPRCGRLGVEPPAGPPPRAGAGAGHLLHDQGRRPQHLGVGLVPVGPGGRAHRSTRRDTAAPVNCSARSEVAPQQGVAGVTAQTQTPAVPVDHRRRSRRHRRARSRGTSRRRSWSGPRWRPGASACQPLRSGSAASSRSNLAIRFAWSASVIGRSPRHDRSLLTGRSPSDTTDRPHRSDRPRSRPIALTGRSPSSGRCRISGRGGSGRGLRARGGVRQPGPDGTAPEPPGRGRPPSPPPSTSGERLGQIGRARRRQRATSARSWPRASRSAALPAA